MSLSDFEFKSSYNKIDNDIAEDFYLPCMRNSVNYDRISGYFGSTIYIIAWLALKDFVDNGGKMRIICSPYITDEDAQALREGNAARQNQIIRTSLSAELKRMFELPYLEKPSRLLACLISNETIKIKLAIPQQNSHPAVRQLFHDKVGIFSDSDGNKIGFRGSINETFKGLSNSGNIESADVFQSWDGGKEEIRVREAADFFDRLWGEKIEAVSLYKLPEEIMETLHEKADNIHWETLLEEVKEDITKSKKWLPASGKNIKPLRPHQAAALEAWRKKGRRGILEHATGSGKTFTALCAIRNALYRNQSVLILVPSIGLLEQWEIEAKKALSDIDVKFLICGTGHSQWKNDNTLRIWTQKSNELKKIVIATMDTASSDDFISKLSQGEHLFVVADEVHRIGSLKRRNFFKVISGDRLGLSATPIRFGDREGTAALFEYFGGIVPPIYTLQDAIKDGVLTKYFYHPITLKLSEAEQEEWDIVSQEIKKLCAQLLNGREDDDSIFSNNRLKTLLLRRARIVKEAEGKVPMALQIIEKVYQKGQKWIVYCDNQQQLNQVLRLLIKSYDAYEYHSEMLGDRKETLNYFSQFGGILVSIKCLDEGIDIPSTTHALVLASSKNPREFIQRRGRILRKSDGKHFAHLYDVIVVPNCSSKDYDKSTNIIASELARAIQFGEWAENPSCIAELKNIAIDYDLDIDTLSKKGIENDDSE